MPSSLEETMEGAGDWAGAPPATRPRPPPVTDAAAVREFERAAERPPRKVAGCLGGAALMHLLSVPISLVLLRTLLGLRSDLSWDEVFDYLAGTPAMGILLAGIVGQVLFAAIAGLGAFLVRSDRPAVAILMTVLGATAAAFSFLVFGGIVGIFGGILSIVGGAMATSRPRPAAAYMYPPPYIGPPPRPPP